MEEAMDQVLSISIRVIGLLMVKGLGTVELVTLSIIHLNTYHTVEVMVPLIINLGAHADIKAKEQQTTGLLARMATTATSLPTLARRQVSWRELPHQGWPWAAWHPYGLLTTSTTTFNTTP